MQEGGGLNPAEDGVRFYHVRGKKDGQGTGVLSLLVSLALADGNELPREIQQMRSVGEGRHVGSSRANIKAARPLPKIREKLSAVEFHMGKPYVKVWLRVHCVHFLLPSSLKMCAQ